MLSRSFLILALLVGLAAMLLIMPVPALLGAGAAWHPPGSDQAQSVSGHLAFQADAWRWPLLDVQRLFWPHGITLTLVDSNPLVSLLMKIWTHATGRAPVNALGAFVGLCLVLQPVAGAWAARGLGASRPAALAAAVLAAAWPALMIRMGHINLCAHFLLLLALGLVFRRLDGPARIGRWVVPGVLLVVAVLTHPYLFQLCGAVLGAGPMQSLIRRRPAWWRDWAGLAIAGVVAMGVLVLLSGPIGGGEKGFTFFSMNVLSPFWPQRSGVFGPDWPVIDATGGQYEGYNWLGAGTLLALLVAVFGRQVRAPAWGLVVVLGGLTLIALSSQVWVGHVKVIDLGTKPWEDVFGSFRSAGRAFWPVAYAIMLGAVAAVDRLPHRLAWPVLAVACVVQLVDIRPLVTEARSSWTTGSGIKVPDVPAGTTLFTVAPHPGCAPEASIKARGPIMLLNAVRMGAMTGDIGLGRSPRWFSCERILSDALELPLLPGETRAFFGSTVNPALLGADAVCRREGDIIQCSRGTADFPGEAVAPAPAPPPLALPAVLDGAALAPVLGTGWALSGGIAWSEGPQSTLLIPVGAARDLNLVIQAGGVAYAPGEARTVTLRLGWFDRPGTIVLPDTGRATLAIPVPAAAIQGGWLRVAFNTIRPVDPARRGLAAPVNRAAIRLYGIQLTP